MSEHDPMHELRAAWGQLNAPDPTPEAMDEETAAVVLSLRSAWAALEPPPVRIPPRLRAGRRWWEGPLPVRLAAGILFLIGSLVLVGELSRPAGPLDNSSTDRTDVADVSTPVELALKVRVVEPEPIENGIVMTHGKVRLVMLQPSPFIDSEELFNNPEKSK